MRYVLTILILLTQGHAAFGQEGTAPLSPKYKAGFLLMCNQVCDSPKCVQTCNDAANPQADEAQQCINLSRAVENWLLTEWPRALISPFV